MLEAVGRLEARARQCAEPSSLWMLGLVHMNLQHYRRALQWLRCASELSPEDLALSGLVGELEERLQGLSRGRRAAAGNLPAHSLAGRRVLLVDDSATVRKVLSFTLEHLGLRVAVAGSGLEGLARVREDVPELVLLDIKMPDVSGYQVCRMLKSDEQTRDIPIVMLTGCGEQLDKERSREVGAVGHITKPAEPATLLETLGRCLAA